MILAIISVSTAKQLLHTIQKYKIKLSSKSRKRLVIIKRDNFQCVCCSRTARFVIIKRFPKSDKISFQIICSLGKKRPIELTIDHAIPKSLGGMNEPTNLQTMCKICNKAKRNYIEEFKNIVV